MNDQQIKRLNQLEEYARSERTYIRTGNLEVSRNQVIQMLTNVLAYTILIRNGD